jgi:hypothetical protein
MFSLVACSSPHTKADRLPNPSRDDSRGQFFARGRCVAQEPRHIRSKSDVDKFWFAIPQTAQKSHPVSQSENPVGGGNREEHWKRPPGMQAQH